MTTNRQIFIQGRGLASALGMNLDAALQTLRRGKVPPRPMTVAPGSTCPYFAIPDDTPDWHARSRRIVRSVVAECGPRVDREAPLFVASSSLNVGALEAGGPSPSDCLGWAEEVAAWLEWRGPVYWMATACTSAFNAILSARRLIGAGAAENALVLGLELGNRFSSAGFGAMQLLDPVAPRPLARDRAGLVLGEAAAALYLGREPARWRVRGGANIVNGSSPTGASRATVAEVVHKALADSAIDREQIALIKLQAAGSPQNDGEEILGLRQVFGPLPALTTLKTCIGHTLGASGAAELALLTRCLESGLLPDLAELAPDPSLDAVFAKAPPEEMRVILANILGFGGGHASVVLSDEGTA